MSNELPLPPFEQGFNQNPATNPHKAGSAEATQYDEGKAAGEVYRRSKQKLDASNLIGKSADDVPSPVVQNAPVEKKAQPAPQPAPAPTQQ